MGGEKQSDYWGGIKDEGCCRQKCVPQGRTTAYTTKIRRSTVYSREPGPKCQIYFQWEWRRGTQTQPATALPQGVTERGNWA